MTHPPDDQAADGPTAELRAQLEESAGETRRFAGRPFEVDRMVRPFRLTTA